MTQDVELRCRCGEVRGRVTDASPQTVNRMICYCDDCQAFLHHLGRDDLLDAHGGTDVVQVAPASLSFVEGAERIVGVRLGPKGLFRWYASCCKTPVGNTLTPAVPFVGIVARAFDAPDVVADFRWLRSGPFPTRRSRAGVAVAPVFEHANYPGTIGTGFLTGIPRPDHPECCPG